MSKTVAYMRRWAHDNVEPFKEYNAKTKRLGWAKQFRFLPVTTHKCFPDDVPLIVDPAYKAPNEN